MALINKICRGHKMIKGITQQKNNNIALALKIEVM